MVDELKEFDMIVDDFNRNSFLIDEITIITLFKNNKGSRKQNREKALAADYFFFSTLQKDIKQAELFINMVKELSPILIKAANEVKQGNEVVIDRVEMPILFDLYKENGKVTEELKTLAIDVCNFIDLPF